MPPHVPFLACGTLFLYLPVLLQSNPEGNLGYEGPDPFTVGDNVLPEATHGLDIEPEIEVRNRCPYMYLFSHAGRCS